MNISAELNTHIIAFLESLSNIQDIHGQQAFINSAGVESNLSNQITFGVSSGQFVRLLIPKLVSYGKLSDGRDALEAVLEAAKQYFGQEGQEEADSLIHQWRAYREQRTGNTLEKRAHTPGIDEFQLQSLRDKHQELRRRYQMVMENIRYLYEDYDNETRGRAKLQIKRELDKEKSERESIEHEMRSLESQMYALQE